MHTKLMSSCMLALFAGLLLSGCNNDSNRNQGSAQPPSTDDAFVAQVRLQTDGANAMSDTAETTDISAIAETSPEQTEPQEVAF